ncbi:MAG: tetratricopeptide repeat protein, partial [Chloroflexota bacterium]
LARALRNGTRVVLRGPHGVGKTALARAVVHRLRREFRDGSFELDLSPDARPSTWSALEAVLKYVRGPDVEIPDEFTALSQAYADALKNRRLILIVQHPMETWIVRQLEPPPHCGLIVIATGRVVKFEDYVEHEVRPLSDVDGFALLQRWAPRLSQELDAAQQAELAAQCAGLPLALRLLGAALAQAPQVPTAEVLTRLQRHRARVDVWRRVLDVVCGLLPPELVQAWRMLAALPDGFDSLNATITWALPDESGDLPDPAYGLSDTARANLDHLLALGLLTRTFEGSGYVMHAAARAYVLVRARPDVDSARDRLVSAYAALVDHMVDLPEDASPNLSDFVAAEWPVMLTAHERAKERMRRGDEAAARLLLTLAQAQKAMGDSVSSYHQIFWLEAAVEAARLLDERHALTTLLCLLAELELEQGWTLSPVAHLTEAIELAEQDNSTDLQMAALMTMGRAHMQTAKWGAAQSALQRTVELARQLGDESFEAQALYLLAFSCAVTDKHREAIAYCEQTLVLARKAGQKPLVAELLKQLVDLHSKLGERQAALPCAEEAHALFQELGDRKEAVTMQLSAGVSCSLLGEHARAIRLLEAAILRLERYGMHQNTCVALSNMGASQMVLRQFGQAARVFARLRSMARSQREPVLEIVALNGLAQAEAALDHPRKALPLLEEGARLAESRGELSLLAQAHSSLSHVHALLEDYDKAVWHGRQARDLAKRIGNEFMLAMGRYNLALHLGEAGRKGLARREMGAAIEYFEAHGHEEQARLAHEQMEKLG